MWDFGDPGSGLLNNSSQMNPSHEYLYSGTYYVTLMVENGYGCRDYVVKPIYVDIVYNVYIPNVFTPDGNGLNDVFQPKGIGIDESEYKMMIFDRWGELIYESNNFQKGWDGSVKGSRGKAKEDVYVYKIFIKDLKGKIHEYVGHVTCLPNSNDE
jgi:gliding motility-associated-like protein